MKTVIEMAREAGGMFDHMMWVNRDLAPVFERFNELARADEREGCAALCDQLSDSSRDLRFGAAIRARGNT